MHLSSSTRIVNQASRALRVASLNLALLPWICSGSDWSFNAGATLTESFDSNVYLQDQEPSPSVPDAAQPFQESFVTSVTPKAGFAFKPCLGFNVSGSYAPEVTFYHAEPGEDYVAHRLALLFNGVVGKVNWQMANSVTYVDGNEVGLNFGGPGGAPAIGGVPIRDRREALIYRNSFGAFHKHGDWFFRPAVSSYIHDFRTEQRNPALFPYYENYLDRNDFNIGVDAGYQIVEGGHLFLAYRAGWQHQTQRPPGSIYDYSNDYQRFLVGFEGRVTDWLKLNVFVGPDWRNFNHRTMPGFDPDPVRLFIDGAAVITLSSSDTVTLTVKRYEQPAFASTSAYEDITYDFSWRHRLNDHWGATAGFKVYAGDWEPPVAREDWIYTVSAGVAYTHDKHWSGDMGYSYDWVDSRVPNTEGREFTRHLVWLSVRYVF